MGCKIEWRDNFYPEDAMKRMDYGCYREDTFEKVVVNGVAGRLSREGCCPIHGVIVSRLAGGYYPEMHKDHGHYPCGACMEIRSKEDSIDEKPLKHHQSYTANRDGEISEQIAKLQSFIAWSETQTDYQLEREYVLIAISRLRKRIQR